MAALAVALTILALLLCGCASVPQTHGIPNWQVVTPPAKGEVAGIARGGRPNALGWRMLRAMGYTTVINLDTVPDPAQPGMTMLQYPITTWQQEFGLVGSQLEAALLMLQDHPRATFVHCKHGENRTGALIKKYRMEVCHWSPERADAEFLAFGGGSSFHALKAYARGH
jgi:hypothetical protein